MVLGDTWGTLGTAEHDPPACKLAYALLAVFLSASLLIRDILVDPRHLGEILSFYSPRVHVSRKYVASVWASLWSISAFQSILIFLS